VDVETALKSAMEIEGALGAAIVDAESGMALGTLGGDGHLDLELAGAGNSQVVRAQLRALAMLEMQDDVEDLLITLGRQYHLIRLLRTTWVGTYFAYLALDRARADLETAPDRLRGIEQVLVA
jgi:hypothetical protein